MISNWKKIKCIFCEEKYCIHDLRKRNKDYDFVFVHNKKKYIGQLINNKFSLYTFSYKGCKCLAEVNNLTFKNINKEFIIKIINNLIFA